MPTVEKKVNAKQRHQRAISRFNRWLTDHPDAPMSIQVKKFDSYCDAEAKKK